MEPSCVICCLVLGRSFFPETLSLLWSRDEPSPMALSQGPSQGPCITRAVCSVENSSFGLFLCHQFYQPTSFRLSRRTELKPQPGSLYFSLLHCFPDRFGTWCVPTAAESEGLAGHEDAAPIFQRHLEFSRRWTGGCDHNPEWCGQWRRGVQGILGVGRSS